MLVEKKLRPSAVAATIRVVLVVVGAGQMWAMTAQPSGPAVRVKETSFSRLALTDLLFTQDVLLEGRAMSRVDCSKKCVDTRGCVMTTFHPSPQGPPHHCRLYSTLHQATDPSRHVAGADSFAAGPTIVKNTTSADSLTETEQSCSRDTQSCQTTVTTDIPDEASTAPSQTTLTTDIPDEASTDSSQTTLTSNIPDEASTAPSTTDGPATTTSPPDEASTTPSQTSLTTDIPDEASTTPSQTTLTTDNPDETSTAPSETTLTTDIPKEASTAPIQTTLTTDIPDEASTAPSQTTLATDIPDEASTDPSQTTLTSDIPDEASTDPSQTTLTTDIPDEASTDPSQTTLTSDIPDEASTVPSQTTLTTDIPDEASTVPIQTTLTTDIPDEASTDPSQTTLTSDIPDEASTVPIQTTLTTDIPDEASTAPSTTDGPATTTSPPCSAGSCSWDYQVWCGRCLLVKSLYKPYSGAIQHCTDTGGRLVMPKTRSDLQCVQGATKPPGYIAPFWVDASDMKVPGQLEWKDGTPLPDNSELWGPGQPSVFNTGSRCVACNTDIKLVVQECKYSYKLSLCEKSCS